MTLLKLVGDLPTSPEGKEELVQQADDETLVSLTVRFMRQRLSHKLTNNLYLINVLLNDICSPLCFVTTKGEIIFKRQTAVLSNLRTLGGHQRTGIELRT